MNDNKNEIETLFDDTTPAPQPSTPVSPQESQAETPSTVIGEINNGQTVANGAQLQPSTSPVLGTPVITEPPKKSKKAKKMNKNTMFILAVLFIVILACGGYWVYTNIINKPIIINLKSVKVELGEAVPTDLDRYLDKMEGNKSDYRLDLSAIVENQIGDYTYKVSYKKQTKIGNLTIEDTIAPKLTLKNVTIAVGETPKPEDFVEKCEDKSACAYSFAESTQIGEMTKIGMYDIEVVATDEAGNHTSATAKLSVASSAENGTLTVSGTTSANQTIGAPLKYTYTILFDEDQTFSGATLKVEATYTEESSYNSAKRLGANKWKDVVGVEGTLQTNDTDQTITYQVNTISLDFIKSKINRTELQDTYNDIKDAFLNAGYQEEQAQ